MVRGELKRVRLLWIKAIPTNKRQPRSERTLARTLNGAGDNWGWCPQRLGQQHSRVVQEFLSTKREYAKGRRYEVAHLKCIRAIQYQGTFRRFLFKYNRWIYISWASRTHLENWGRNSLSKKLQLILFGVVGLNGLDLDDDCGISLGEGLAFCCDSAGYITWGKSQCHRNRCSNSQCEVLDCLDEALFLSFC